ncbi:TauD/TfdA family dioxygenase [aff. Roholtiella sp. LEGE 12411]|uniref:TauD/TfdA family dioxygenase n=1 Tax=aff. Roholtiella sp. LEGE 12411 TaxID=1828822 RepID=UPI00187E7C67|nr:TauD/TfdA family dioxygenase [aff. Roholtiella sp. LEGE 12411]MBE9035918.1 TauD/TfdA family dioxygenase [aff. Roholtiella sp. LEGE 12411]
MKSSNFSDSRNIDRFRLLPRKTISIFPEDLVKVEHIFPQSHLPLVLKPNLDGLDLAEWASDNRDFIRAKLLQYGGILFRNFSIDGSTQFEKLIKSISGDLLEEPTEQNIHNEEASPKQNIFFHNEYSDKSSWPLKIFFFCIEPAQQGGEIPLADCRRVIDHINSRIKEQFLQKKWMLVRNFGGNFSQTWQRVFKTTDKSVVEKYCLSNNIEFEWKDNNRLRTRTVLPIIAQHPETDELIWFNQVAFFHISTLEPLLREALLAFPEEDLPNNTYYGDGSPIETSVIDEISQAYRQETVIFPGNKGDILMLDNMLVAHGRTPFVGHQEVLVGMSEPFSYSQVALE